MQRGLLWIVLGAWILLTTGCGGESSAGSAGNPDPFETDGFAGGSAAPVNDPLIEGDIEGECSDDLDNDGDGDFDCADEDCEGLEGCPENTHPDKYEGDDPGECSDGADNDQDDLFDCDDPECFNSPACDEEPTSGGGQSGGGSTGGGETGGGETGGGSETGSGETTGGETGGGCTPACNGKQCGPDGCGATCGECSGGQSCENGTCVFLCEANCAAKQCGDDGCGGSCGECGPEYTCESNSCTPVPVPPDGVTCEPVGSLSCGSSLQASTNDANAVDNINVYGCETWQDQGPELAYEFVASQDQTVTLDLNVNISGHWVAHLYVLENQGQGCHADACIASEEKIDGEVIFEATSGTTYYILVDGFSQWSGDFELDVQCN